MKDWGPLGEIIALAYAVIGALAVLWLVGVFWLALRTAACAVAAVRAAVGGGDQPLSRAQAEGRLEAHYQALDTLAMSVSSCGGVLIWRTLDTGRTEPRVAWRAFAERLNARWFEGRRCASGVKSKILASPPKR